MPSGILYAVVLRIRVVRGFRPDFARSCAGRGKAAAGQAAAMVRLILQRQERKDFAGKTVWQHGPIAAQPGGLLGRSMRCESVHANYQKGEQVNTSSSS